MELNCIWNPTYITRPGDREQNDRSRGLKRHADPLADLFDGGAEFHF